MTINYIASTPKSTANIWNSKAQTIILNSNVEGKMAGICRGLDNYDRMASLDYQRLCAAHLVQVGTPVLIHSTKHQGKQYVFFPLKAKSGDAPKAAALESCLMQLLANGPRWGITSIATHKLGCGSSDIYLDWDYVVHPLLERYFACVPESIAVSVYGVNPPKPLPTTPMPEVEPTTMVMPSVKVTPEVVNMPLDPFIARYALDLNDADINAIFTAPF